MLNYWNRQDNPATFETLEEVRAHAVGVTSRLPGGTFFTQILNPALENYPQGLVYIYRSPNLYGGETGADIHSQSPILRSARYHGCRPRTR